MATVIYYFFSKHSPACQGLTPTMMSFSSYFQVIPVDIDDPMMRRRVLQSSIKTVPTVVVQSPSMLEIFAGQELVQFVNQLAANVKQQMAARMMPPPQPAPAPLAETVLYPTPPPQMPVQSIVNPAIAQQPVQQTQTVNSAMQARLAPQQFDSPPPPQPLMTTQIAANPTQQQAAQMQQQQQQHQQQMQPMQQPQMPQMQPVVQSEIAAGVIDETAMTAPQQSLITPTTGMSMQDITGGNTMARMNNVKGDAIAQAQAMQQAREAEDSAINPRSNAMQLVNQMQTAQR